MRVRRKDTTSGKQIPAKIICDPSPEAVEAPTGSVSQAGSSSHAGLVHNTSSPMTSGQAGVPIMRGASVLTICTPSLPSRLAFLQHALLLVIPDGPTCPWPAICGTPSLHLDTPH
jgi:hypothetical protein